METKEVIRKRIKEARKQLSSMEIQKKSQQICDRIRLQNWYQNKNTILCLYSAISGEVDLRSLMEEAFGHGRLVALPRVQGKEMDFYLISSYEDLEEGAFHILEPKSNCKVYYPKAEDVILVPGVAFSEKGNRIGFGQGFYDRYLSRFPKGTSIGIAYEMQIAEDWGKEDFDVSMDEIITECRCITTSK